MRKRYIVLIVVVVVLLAVRISLSFIIKNQINKQIDEIEGYSGEVKGVTMQLIRGGIQIHNLTLFNEVSNDPSSAHITLDNATGNIFWSELFKGRVVVKVKLNQLHISFTQRTDEIPKEELDPIKIDELLEELIPFSINSFRITNSTISYRDITSSPQIDIFLSDFFLEATNIQNTNKVTDTLPSTLLIQTGVMNSGFIKLEAGFNLLKKIPDFEYTLEIENVDLTQFDPFIEAYANFNLNAGLLNVYSEAAAHDGFLTGYIKPIIENLEITPTEDNVSALRKVYEAIIQGIGNLLKNDETVLIGTRVEFEGRIDEPDVSVWSAVWLLLRNAFFDGIKTGVDDTIDFDDLT